MYSKLSNDESIISKNTLYISFDIYSEELYVFIFCTWQQKC